MKTQSNTMIDTGKIKDKDPNYRNVFLLSLGFGLCFFGTNTFMNFAVPILGNLAAGCMAVVNFVNAFSNFLVPSVISFFGTPQRALFWCGFSYMLYITQFSYIIPPVSYAVCALHGFLSAVCWASQGIILGNNSSDKDRGKKSGFFLAVYMSGSAIGNIIASFIIKWMGEVGSVNNGWNGKVSFLFLFLGLFAVTAVIPYSMLRPAVPYESESGCNTEEVKSIEAKVGDTVITDKKEGEASVIVHTTEPVKEKQSVCNEILDVLKTGMRPRMLLLLCFFFFDGYQQVFLSSQFTRQLNDLSSVGTLMGLFSIADVIFSYVLGNLSDRFGHGCVVTIATISELVGFVLAWLANAKQNWLVYATGIVLAISDAGYQTECLAIVNQYFEKDRTNANSVFRMLQCFGFAIALVLTPMFITVGNKHSTTTQWLYEIIIAAVLAVGGYIGCMVFLHISKKKPLTQ